jgi:hypothetical protein
MFGLMGVAVVGRQRRRGLSALAAWPLFGMLCRTWTISAVYSLYLMVKTCRLFSGFRGFDIGLGINVDLRTDSAISVVGYTACRYLEESSYMVV